MERGVDKKSVVVAAYVHFEALQGTQQDDKADADSMRASMPTQVEDMVRTDMIVCNGV